MSSEWIIGALALITIGGTLALAIFHFGFHLKDPENLEAAKSVAKDRESATTAVSADGVNGRSLRQRLDEAPTVDERFGARPVRPHAMHGFLDAKWPDLRSMLTGQPPSR